MIPLVQATRDLAAHYRRGDVPDSAYRDALHSVLHVLADSVATDGNPNPFPGPREPGSQHLVPVRQWLHQNPSPDIRSAALAHLYELWLAQGASSPHPGISPQPHLTTRVSQGSFYTPRPEVDVACAEAMELLLQRAGLTLPNPLTVCDPAAGCGEFLLGILRNVPAHHPLVLVAADCDQTALTIAEFRIRLVAGPQVTLHCHSGDSLLAAGSDSSVNPGFRWKDVARSIPEAPAKRHGGADETAAGVFHLVVTNPPYLRHEAIRCPSCVRSYSASQRTRGSGEAPSPRATVGPPPAGVAGTAACDPPEVQAGGSCTVPTDQYKEMLREALAARDHGGTGLPLLPVRRMDLSAWFLLLARNLLRGDGVMSLVLTDSWMDTRYGDALQARLASGTNRLLVPTADRTFRDAGVLTSILVHSPATMEGKVDEDKTKDPVLPPSHHRIVLPCPVPHRDGWGARYVRMPRELLSGLDWSRTVPLGQILHLKYGLKTGLTDFFVLPKGSPQAAAIQPEYLMPFVTLSSETYWNHITSPGIRKMLFVCRQSKDELGSPGHHGALQHIEQGESRMTAAKGKNSRSRVPYPQASSVAGHSPYWYSLRPQRTGCIVLPCIIHRLHSVAWNPERAQVSNNFFHGEPADGVDPLVLLALLNSRFSALMMEVFGRPKGMGALNLYGPDLAKLPLPDPRQFPAKLSSELRDAFLRRIESRQDRDAPPSVFSDDPIHEWTEEALGVGVGLSRLIRDFVVEGWERRLNRGLRISSR